MSLRIMIVAALLAGLGAEARAGDRLDRGLEQYRALDLEGALETFEQIARDEAEGRDVRVEALRNAGLCYLALGKENYARVKETIRAILALDPTYRIDVDRTPKVMRTYYFQVTQELGLFPPPESPGIETMAILDFSTASVGRKEEGWGSMGKALASLLVTDLQGLSKLRVVERERIEFLLQEIELQASDKVDQETAVRIGKLAGAHSVCTGGLTRIEDKVRIDVRLVSVETGEVLLAHEMTGKTKDFFELEKKLARAFAEQIDVEVTKAEMESLEESKAAKRSYETLRYYSLGLDYLSQEKYPEARDTFEKVLSIDPDMELAQAKLRLAEQELFFASAD